MAWWVAPFIAGASKAFQKDDSGPYNPLGYFAYDKLQEGVSKLKGGPISLDKQLAYPVSYPKGPGREEAFTTLMQILGAQGKTDPRLANQQRVGIQRGTQNLQGDALQQLAMAGPGMQQSGMGQALLSAIGAGGQERLAGFEAQEAAAAEERKRNDLLLWLQMFVNPALDAEALMRGIQMANRQYGAQENAALIGALGQLGGAAISNWDTLFPRTQATPAVNAAAYATGQ